MLISLFYIESSSFDVHIDPIQQTALLNYHILQLFVYGVQRMDRLHYFQYLFVSVVDQLVLQSLESLLAHPFPFLIHILIHQTLSIKFNCLKFL